MFASHIRLVTFGMRPNFFPHLDNWKQSLQYLMKCLCCGTWTHPHPQRPAASQVGHYCSHLQRARASLHQQWCQSSGICRKKTQGTWGRCRTHLPGGRKTAAEDKKKATTTAQRSTQSKATPTEPCYATARSQALAAVYTQRLQRTPSAGKADAFLLAHLSCQQQKHSFALAPSAKHPLPLNDPMHQYLQPSTGSRCPPLPYPWPGLGALL